MFKEMIRKDDSLMKKFILFFIILQPLLDLFTSLNVRFTNSSFLSIGVLVRTVFMIIVGLYIFMGEKDSKKSRLYYMMLGVYFMSFLFLAFGKGGMGLIAPEIKGLVKTFYFPVVLVALFEINKRETLFEDTGVFKLVITQYLLVIAVATLTSTSFKSYDYGYGSVGWFFAANEIGAIIAILLPFILLPFLMKKTQKMDILLLLLLIFSVFYIGTKVPPLSIIIYMSMMLVVAIWSLLYRSKTQMNAYLKLGILTVLLAVVVSIQSPLTKNVVATYGQFFGESTEILTGSITDEQFLKEKKDREIEQAILSSRNLYNDLIKENFQRAEFSGKLLGIGYYVQDEDGNRTDKMIEMDGYDIFYRHGILGSILYFIPLLFIAVSLLNRFFRNIKKYLQSYLVISLCYSVLIGLFIGLLTGHVLTSPAVSIYIILAILMLYSKLQQGEKTSEVKL